MSSQRACNRVMLVYISESFAYPEFVRRFLTKIYSCIFACDAINLMVSCSLFVINVSTPDDQFWRHLARWWVWAFQTLSANEISQIWKCTMASPEYFRNLLTDFAKINMLMSLDPLDTVSQKIGNFKNKSRRRLPFGKSKNRNISALNGQVLKKIGMVMFLIPPTVSAYKILCF